MNPEPVIQEAKRSRYSRLKRTLFVFGIIFVLGYIASYVALSRAGIKEAEPVRLPGFWYLPISKLTEDNRDAWRTQYLLAILFAPANWIDRTFFDGPWPAGEPLWGIGPRRGKGTGDR